MEIALAAYIIIGLMEAVYRAHMTPPYPKSPRGESIAYYFEGALEALFVTVIWGPWFAWWVFIGMCKLTIRLFKAWYSYAN